MSETYIAGMTSSEFYANEGSQDMDLSGAIEHGIQHSAKDLAGRHDTTTQVGGSSDLEAESNLLSLQRELANASNSGDLMKVEQLERQVYELASKLTGSSTAPQQAPTQEPEDFIQAYRDAHLEVDADLAYAAEVMGNDLASGFNEMITGNDELARSAALDTISHLRQNPDAFVARESSAGIDAYTEEQIASQYGKELAHDISVLGNSVAQGVITSQQAIATASRNPELKNAIYALAEQGLIQVAL